MKIVKQDQKNFQAQKNLINNEEVFFSCDLTKFNDEGKAQKRTLVITNNAIYNFNKLKLQRRIPLERLEAITASKQSWEFITHIKDDYDYRFISYE